MPAPPTFTVYNDTQSVPDWGYAGDHLTITGDDVILTGTRVFVCHKPVPTTRVDASTLTCVVPTIAASDGVVALVNGVGVTTQPFDYRYRGDWIQDPDGTGGPGGGDGEFYAATASGLAASDPMPAGLLTTSAIIGGGGSASSYLIKEQFGGAGVYRWRYSMPILADDFTNPVFVSSSVPAGSAPPGTVDLEYEHAGDATFCTPLGDITWKLVDDSSIGGATLPHGSTRVEASKTGASSPPSSSDNWFVNGYWSVYRVPPAMYHYTTGSVRLNIAHGVTEGDLIGGGASLLFTLDVGSGTVTTFGNTTTIDETATGLTLTVPFASLDTRNLFVYCAVFTPGDTAGTAADESYLAGTGRAVSFPARPGRYRWSYVIDVTLAPPTVKGLPPLRQYPRDDHLGGTPRQGKSSRSVQSTARQGWSGTYR